MARQELHSDTMKIEQKPPISDTSGYDGDIVTGEKIGGGSEYLDQLAFMEEPVTIRLEPSADVNADRWFHVAVNGKGGEVLILDRWLEYKYFPVGEVLTTKRKYVEVIIRAKRDTVHTRILNMESERPNNTVDRFTSALTSFSIIEDRNPAGAAWVTEVRRRNT
jgi:hypothetical protein